MTSPAYAAVDDAINLWAKGRGLTILTSSGGEAVRFCYISGTAQECSQISIFPPEGGHIEVLAADIETIDDASLEARFKVQVDDIAVVPGLAHSTISLWHARPKRSATWTMPKSW